MSPNVSVEENWAPEPELMDMPPRRIQVTSEPDLNLPLVPFWVALGAGLIVLGIVLLATSHGRPLFTVPGILIFLTGVGCAILGPVQASRHKQRCEYLVTNGVPKMVRVITSDNLAGSVYKRNVRYQYIDLNGDIQHRDVNIDDRLLPKRIPANMTAVMDVNTGDIELYLALPFRAVQKTALATPVTIPTPVQSPAVPTATALPSIRTTPVATPTTVAIQNQEAIEVKNEKMVTMANVPDAPVNVVNENMLEPERASKPKSTRKTTKKEIGEKSEKKEEVYE